jgi:hypothetical protein
MDKIEYLCSCVNFKLFSNIILFKWLNFVSYVHHIGHVIAMLALDHVTLFISCLWTDLWLAIALGHVDLFISCVSERASFDT